MGLTDEQRTKAEDFLRGGDINAARRAAGITQQPDPRWRFGDDFLREQAANPDSPAAKALFGDSAQAEWEHGETRPLQTREEIHNRAIRAAMEAFAVDPGGANRLWSLGDILNRLTDELVVVNATAEQPSTEELRKQTDERLAHADELLRRLTEDLAKIPPTVTEQGLSSSFPPGSPESWAMVAIHYLIAQPRQDHPISHLLVDRLRHELEVRDQEPG